MSQLGEAGKGAAGGALAGAGIGSVVPGIGTGIGALAGGVIGGIGGYLSGGNTESDNESATRKMLMDYYHNAQNRQAPGLAPTQYGSLSGVRNQQQTLADQLAAISSGKGPSLAEQQLRSATDRNVAQQASFANSGMGGPMAAARAANNSARLGAMAGQDAAAARIAEANQARQLLGLNLHGMREADENMSRFNAGQGNEMSQAQMWAQLKSRGMDDEAAMAAIRGLQGQNSAQYGRPTFGDQMLAGGAGLFSLGATQAAQAAAAKKA